MKKFKYSICLFALRISMPIYPLQRDFYPQNCRDFLYAWYKVKEKTAIVPHCTPSFKTQWAP